MAATISTQVLAGTVRALRQARSRSEIGRIETAFAATGASADELALVADVAALALGRLQATAEARLDGLTGVFNRRGFFETGHARLAACPGPVTVALIDVDGLKAINDRYGHAVGSAVLRAAAQALERAYPGAVVGRLGGDEFGALILDRSDATTLAQRLHATVAARVGDAVPLRLSAGFATGIATGPRDLDLLLRHADDHLYEQRRSRRRNDRGPRFARADAPWAARVPERTAG